MCLELLDDIVLLLELHIVEALVREVTTLVTIYQGQSVCGDIARQDRVRGRLVFEISRPVLTAVGSVSHDALHHLLYVLIAVHRAVYRA